MLGVGLLSVSVVLVLGAIDKVLRLDEVLICATGVVLLTTSKKRMTMS